MVPYTEPEFETNQPTQAPNRSSRSPKAFEAAAKVERGSTRRVSTCQVIVTNVKMVPIRCHVAVDDPLLNRCWLSHRAPRSRLDYALHHLRPWWPRVGSVQQCRDKAQRGARVSQWHGTFWCQTPLIHERPEYARLRSVWNPCQRAVAPAQTPTLTIPQINALVLFIHNLGVLPITNSLRRIFFLTPLLLLLNTPLAFASAIAMSVHATHGETHLPSAAFDARVRSVGLSVYY
ncbi:hypothetical protein DB88DRAFT_502683 [Papiliotrema laurentii]|uniref:Uncharacterized protein n=1 Tax=Papiliotrema laurentii TaxID=5418 RepID=A0AAD9CRW3_PAPLA|nr:hypothetical protein DB88DRAFT_502683 [Papiliotrema laurentii]